MKKTTAKNKGFTLAELLMAVWVMSIILAAVATLSFALGSANDSVDNTSEIYSRIRYTTMRISELMRGSKLICANFGGSAAIWRADDNGNSQINPGEIVYVERDGTDICIKLVSFQPAAAVAGYVLTISNITSGLARTWLETNCQKTSITLIDNCSYAAFTTDLQPPFSKTLNIFFSVNNEGLIENYQISEYLRCQAGYLLGGSGQIVSSDDDMQ